MQAISVENSANGIATVTFTRPERLNALSRETVAELHAILDRLHTDDQCRVVILTGAGRGFCSGQDMVAANERNQSGDTNVIERLHWQEQFSGIGRKMRAMPQIIIAAVNGPAVGAGMAIALAADIRIATPTASFHVGAVRIGLTAGESGISYLLPRMIGMSRAFDILLAGRPIGSEEALKMGLVSAVVESDRLLPAAHDRAAAILANSPYAVANSKKLIWENIDAPSFEAAIAAENRAQILGTMTEDYIEAGKAFSEKRAPRFKGR